MKENIDVLFHSDMVFSPSQEVKNSGLYVSEEQYKQIYQESISNPDNFWDTVAKESIDWFKPYQTVFEWNYPNYKWFVGGKLNITHNCLDRHIIAGNGAKTAYIYCDELGSEKSISYQELYEKVCKFSNGLTSIGVQKGDRVTIYMPLTIEQIVAILACARIGAIHSVVYAGFSASALKLRIEDAQSKVIIASSYTQRRGKKINLKEIVDEAVQDLSFIEHIIVDKREDTYPLLDKELNYQDFMALQSINHTALELDSEDALFILYTSGTTGKPKGVLHTQGGYNVFTHYTAKLSFNLRDNDVYWCTADTGWITGHSYIVYGPLSNGVTSVIFEGAPNYPDPSVWWKVIEKYKVTKFYTAPTAIRMFMKFGEDWLKGIDLSSLQIIGSVGEPINPEAWLWYYKYIGGGKAVVIDTWWQTETGGHMITSLPSCKQKPGKAGLPYLGVELDVIQKDGSKALPNTVGLLVVKRPWPSALRTCYGDESRFTQYWTEIAGNYFAGDLATKDEDGYIMILGRADDVLNVSGHRIGTAEVESALVGAESVAEAAVIGKPHEITGQSIKAFVILKEGYSASDELISSIKAAVKKELGAIGVPDEIEVMDKLPKTRSGKIMRRVLKAKELGQELGDTSTLED